MQIWRWRHNVLLLMEEPELAKVRNDLVGGSLMLWEWSNVQLCGGAVALI